MLVVIMVAIILSMDAFSLSLAYGTLNLEKKSIFNLAFIVGLFHFLMPLLGMLIGATVLHILPVEPSLVIFLVLVFIGIKMIIDSYKEIPAIKLITFKEILVFGFIVSIDSFSVGIGLKALSDNYFLSAFIFFASSFIFSYLGLNLGKKINKLIGKTSTFIGGIILIIIGMVLLFY